MSIASQSEVGNKTKVVLYVSSSEEIVKATSFNEETELRRENVCSLANNLVEHFQVDRELNILFNLLVSLDQHCLADPPASLPLWVQKQFAGATHVAIVCDDGFCQATEPNVQYKFKIAGLIAAHKAGFSAFTEFDEFYDSLFDNCTAQENDKLPEIFLIQFGKKNISLIPEFFRPQFPLFVFSSEQDSYKRTLKEMAHFLCGLKDPPPPAAIPSSDFSESLPSDKAKNAIKLIALRKEQEKVRRKEIVLLGRSERQLKFLSVGFYLIAIMMLFGAPLLASYLLYKQSTLLDNAYLLCKINILDWVLFFPFLAYPVAVVTMVCLLCCCLREKRKNLRSIGYGVCFRQIVGCTFKLAAGGLSNGLVYLLLGMLIFHFKNSAPADIRCSLEKGMNMYGNQSEISSYTFEVQGALESIQKIGNCCGINSYLDWKEYSFGKGMSTTPGLFLLQLNARNFTYLPPSCCIGEEDFCHVLSNKTKKLGCKSVLEKSVSEISTAKFSRNIALAVFWIAAGLVFSIIYKRLAFRWAQCHIAEE